MSKGAEITLHAFRHTTFLGKIKTTCGISIEWDRATRRAQAVTCKNCLRIREAEWKRYRGEE